MKFVTISTPIQSNKSQEKFVSDIKEISKFIFDKIKYKVELIENVKKLQYLKIHFEQSKGIESFLNNKLFDIKIDINNYAIQWKNDYITRGYISITKKPVDYHERVVNKTFNDIFKEEKPLVIDHSKINNTLKEGYLIISEDLVLLHYTKNKKNNEIYTDILYLKPKENISKCNISIVEQNYINNSLHSEINSIIPNILEFSENLKNYEEKTFLISSQVRETFSSHQVIDYNLICSLKGKKEIENSIKKNISYYQKYFYLTVKRIDNFALINLYQEHTLSYSGKKHITSANMKIIKINTPQI